MEHAMCNQEGRKVLIECVGFNMQGKISSALYAMYISWMVYKEIVCKFANWTEFAEIGWSVVQDVLKLLAAKGWAWMDKSIVVIKYFVYQWCCGMQHFKWALPHSLKIENFLQFLFPFLFPCSQTLSFWCICVRSLFELMK